MANPQRTGPASYGQRIKAKREAEQYSIRGLGRALGISFSTLARIERGEGNPDRHSQILLNAWLDPLAPVPQCHCVRCVGNGTKHGWVCPRCQRCYAPTVSSCPCCLPSPQDKGRVEEVAVDG